jgi:hypothetical protein
MATDIPRVGSRRALAVAVAVAVGAISLAACGSSGGSVAHLGCHRFCQQAGGFGGGPTGMQVIKFLTSGTVTPASDGTVAIKVQCAVPVPCRGALLLDLGDSSICGTSTQRYIWPAASDLDVAANGTRTFALALLPCAQRRLQQRGQLKAAIIADVALVPMCAKIPQLAAGCKRFVTARGYAPEMGDGLNRLPMTAISLVRR